MAGTKRVLIYRLGSLGDTVVALPGFYLIARAFPEAERRLLTNFPINAKAPAAAAILENTGTVDGYLRYSVGTRNPLELLKLWWSIVRWRPQVLVYLGPARGAESARRDGKFFRMCGIKRLVGVPVTEDMQRCRGDADLGGLELEGARLARNIAELGDARLDDPASWDVRLTPAEKARAAEVLAPADDRPIIAVSIGTKLQANDWGKENWRRLLERTAQIYPHHALAIMGVANERETSEYIAEGWRAASPHGPVLNLCSVLSPRESAAAFARAKVFIGHDSGPIHLASAVQTRCVGIFSARNLPRTWFPSGPQNRVIYHRVDCRGCGLETCIVERKKCLTSITVDEVLDNVRAVLG